MKLGIFTYGTRGDLQPYLALALHFKSKGMDVMIAATGDFREYVEQFDIAFHPLWGDAEQMMQNKEGEQILRSANSIQLMKYYFQVLHDNRVALRRSYEEAVGKVDWIVANAMTVPIVSALSEKYGKKMALTYFMPPVVPTTAFPLADFDFLNFPLYNKLTYKLAQFFFWKFIREDVNEYRRLLGLPELKENLLHHLDAQKILDLYCISSHFIPQPDDWAPHHRITGFINAGFKKQPGFTYDAMPDGLSDWLMKGERPVYIGFGSNAIGDKEFIRNLVSELLQHTSERYLFCTGWSGIDGLPVQDRLFVTKYVDHEQVLPYCKLGVFHGGAGTLATMMRHDLPVVIVSFYTDQPTWGKIVTRKGLGAHVPFQKLDAGKLIDAINMVQSPSVKERVKEMGIKIRGEKGLENAAQAIEDYFNG